MKKIITRLKNFLNSYNMKNYGITCSHCRQIIVLNRNEVDKTQGTEFVFKCGNCGSTYKAMKRIDPKKTTIGIGSGIAAGALTGGVPGAIIGGLIGFAAGSYGTSGIDYSNLDGPRS